VPKQGPEINSRDCLYVLPKIRHWPQCWFSNRRLILFLRSSLETPNARSSPTNIEAEPHVSSPSEILLLLNPACPETQYSPTACRVEMSFGAFWQWWNNKDLATRSGFIPCEPQATVQTVYLTARCKSFMKKWQCHWSSPPLAEHGCSLPYSNKRATLSLMRQAVCIYILTLYIFNFQFKCTIYFYVPSYSIQLVC
jgi:hypothetical protein